MSFATVGAMANVPQAHGLMQSMMHRGVGLGPQGFGRDVAIPGMHNNNAAIQQRMFNAANPGTPPVPPQMHALAQRAAQGNLSQAEAQQAMQFAPPGVAQRAMAQAAPQAQMMGPMQSRMQNPLNAMFGAGSPPRQGGPMPMPAMGQRADPNYVDPAGVALRQQWASGAVPPPVGPQPMGVAPPSPYGAPAAGMAGPAPIQGRPPF